MEERETYLGGPIVSVVIHTDSDGESGSRVRAELGRGMLAVAGREAGWEGAGLEILIICFIVE
jgi:hypothetical protein